MASDFLAGVIEGFYGQPWSRAERLELFDWMAAWGLNTYLYAPKDDLKHRAVWRELYSEPEAATMGEWIRACQQRKLNFIYALSPGLDIGYANEADFDHLRKRFEQMLALGCRNFALLFDDIPDRMSPQDLKRWGSFASAQAQVTNALFQWVRERCPGARFLFCPTPYCGRMAERKLGGEGYLSTLGRELLPEIDVCWTGPEIISREITVSHIQALPSLLRRQPVIWDNLHANDYDGRRFYCGPYSGRSLELRAEVRGLLVNPNCEFPLNFVPLRTLADFLHSQGAWDARTAYLSAMREWLPRFATTGQPVRLEDLTLFGDCYYLPHEEGPEAETLYQLARNLLTGNLLPLTKSLKAERVTPCAPGQGALEDGAHGVTRPTADTSPPEWAKQAILFRQKATRMREFCVRMTELRQRPLFYALSRRIWDLREELDLLERYVEFKSKGGQPDSAFGSDFHLPGTYRGGLVARLQRLLIQRSDGSFAPEQTNDQTSDPKFSTP